MTAMQEVKYLPGGQVTPEFAGRLAELLKGKAR